MNIGNSLICLLLIIGNNFNHLEPTYKIVKKSKREVQLIQGKKVLDKLVISQNYSRISRNNQIIEIINDKVYTIELIIPPIDNFANTYWEISEWKTHNKKFKFQTSLTFKPKGDFKNFKLSINENGIHWKYKLIKTNFVKKGIITFDKFIPKQKINN